MSVSSRAGIAMSEMGDDTNPTSCDEELLQKWMRQRPSLPATSIYAEKRPELSEQSALALIAQISKEKLKSEELMKAQVFIAPSPSLTAITTNSGFFAGGTFFERPLPKTPMPSNMQEITFLSSLAKEIDPSMTKNFTDVGAHRRLASLVQIFDGAALCKGRDLLATLASIWYVLMDWEEALTAYMKTDKRGRSQSEIFAEFSLAFDDVTFVTLLVINMGQDSEGPGKSYSECLRWDQSWTAATKVSMKYYCDVLAPNYKADRRNSRMDAVFMVLSHVIATERNFARLFKKYEAMKDFFISMIKDLVTGYRASLIHFWHTLFRVSFREKGTGSFGYRAGKSVTNSRHDLAATLVEADSSHHLMQICAVNISKKRMFVIDSVDKIQESHRVGVSKAESDKDVICFLNLIMSQPAILHATHQCGQSRRDAIEALLVAAAHGIENWGVATGEYLGPGVHPMMVLGNLINVGLGSGSALVEVEDLENLRKHFMPRQRNTPINHADKANLLTSHGSSDDKGSFLEWLACRTSMMKIALIIGRCLAVASIDVPSIREHSCILIGAAKRRGDGPGLESNVSSHGMDHGSIPTTAHFSHKQQSLEQTIFEYEWTDTRAAGSGPTRLVWRLRPPHARRDAGDELCAFVVSNGAHSESMIMAVKGNRMAAVREVGQPTPTPNAVEDNEVLDVFFAAGRAYCVLRREWTRGAEALSGHGFYVSTVAA